MLGFLKKLTEFGTRLKTDGDTNRLISKTFLNLSTQAKFKTCVFKFSF